VYPKYYTNDPEHPSDTDYPEMPVLEKFTGVFRTWNRAGIRISEEGYVNGIRNGVGINYDDENGQILSLETFVNGVEVGIVRMYEYGKIEYESFSRLHKNGFVEQVFYREFNEKGELNYIQLTPIDGGTTCVYDPSKNIDLRHKYKKEITAFEKEIKLWEKENGVGE